jgi:hypothetical protein
MVASSLFIFSVGFFIYAVSPAYANTEKTNVTAKTNNGYQTYTIVANGYVYYWLDYSFVKEWIDGKEKDYYGNSFAPKKKKLPL